MIVEKELKQGLAERFKKKEYSAFFKTFGCQQNEADSERIRGFLHSLGFGFVSSPLLADLILFNTCAVRHTAENKILGQLGELKNIKKINPKVLIVLCGCMVEQENIKSLIKEKYNFVDLICGAKSLDYFPRLLYKFLTGKEVDNYICDMPVFHESKFKSWIPIMTGCNNFCSYCIVPYVRGREKSLSYEKILFDCKESIKNGSKILTLLGQNVNSYKFEDVNFSRLLEEIDKIDGDFTIRFMTSHPKDFNFELVDVLSNCKHFSGHLHLPVQSGNNRILGLMNRKYTREEYIEKINYAKSKIKNLVITSDIIVGFPGETKEEFEDTVSLVKEVGFSSIFTFIYSPRKGTLAYNMLDSISHDEKVNRINHLIKVQDKISEEFLSRFVGKDLYVVVYDDDKNFSIARTNSNLMVKIKGSIGTGKKVRVKIISSTRSFLIGERIIN